VTSPLRILLLGGSGQIGTELRSTLAPLGAVIAPTRAELDWARLTDDQAFVATSRADVVINAAGYTRVDDAERDRAAAELLNAALPAQLATTCARVGASLVHYSTDYVFAGDARTPYRETDATGPVNWYGETKLAGERAVLLACDRAMVLRTSWVYGYTGTNFARTMLRLARERAELRVVDDQWGSPTWSRAVARGTAQIVSQLADDPSAWRARHGVWHMSAGGTTTWHAFASRLLALDPRAAEHVVHGVSRISTADFGAVARRPAYSALDSGALADALGVRLATWEEQLAEMSLCGDT
jgi:dTDP-4-dehydrorhamnose reductase